MNCKQMIETVHEHFPAKGGLRVLADLNAELRRYAEDVRPWHRSVSLFEQELSTSDDELITTHAGETIQVEQYGASFPLPREVFIVRAKRVVGEMYVDINTRVVYLFQDLGQVYPFSLTEGNRVAYSITLDATVYPPALRYDDDGEDLGSHADAILAGVLGSYYGAIGNYQAAGWWKKEALIARRKAKEASTTDGSFAIHVQSILTPSKDRR